MKRFLALCTLVCFASVSFADGIDIQNASFEEPAMDPGGWTNEYPAWETPENAGDAFVEYIDGFASDGNQHIGIGNGMEVSQDLGVALVPNTTYVLTVGVGNRNDNFSPNDGSQATTFGLYLGGDADGGGTLLADSTVDAGPLGASTFADYSVSYTTGDSVADGNLVVSLRTTGGGRAHYDNVRLNAVPEPAGLALLGTAGIAALALRRRRS